MSNFWLWGPHPAPPVGVRGPAPARRNSIYIWLPSETNSLDSNFFLLGSSLGDMRQSLLIWRVLRGLDCNSGENPGTLHIT